jgi:hypothetical protein
MARMQLARELTLDAKLSHTTALAKTCAHNCCWQQRKGLLHQHLGASSQQQINQHKTAWPSGYLHIILLDEFVANNSLR